MRSFISGFLLFISLFGCQNRKLHGNLKPAERLEGFIARPELSPDGSKIVFVYAEDKEVDTWELYISEVDGRHAKPMTDFKSALIKKAPTWSPDGNQIAFHADINDGAQIFIMNVNDKYIHQITRLPGYNVEPSWSTNGEYIYFNSIKRGRTQIYSVGRDGNNVEHIRPSTGNDWYPKQYDTLLIFSSDFQYKDHYQIYIENQVSGHIDQITHGKGNANFPEISPNGQHIVFTSNRDDTELDTSGEYNLYLINSDGSQLRQLTDLPGQELHAKWFPSGEKVICEHHYDGVATFLIVDINSLSIKKLPLYLQ